MCLWFTNYFIESEDHIKLTASSASAESASLVSVH